MSKELNGQATPEQIATWKRECTNGIYKIDVEGEVAYFRNPVRQDVAKALSMASDENPLAAIEEFGRLCFIGGSDKVLTDDRLFLASTPHLKKKLMGNEATALLVNL